MLWSLRNHNVTGLYITINDHNHDLGEGREVSQSVLRERCLGSVNKAGMENKQQLCVCVAVCKGYKRLMNQRQMQGKHCLCPVALGKSIGPFLSILFNISSTENYSANH